MPLGHHALPSTHLALARREPRLDIHSRTCAQLEEFGWKKIPHSAFPPDLAPTYYSFSRSLQNHLSGKTLQDEEDVRRTVAQFFASKTSVFFQRGIQQLVDRWQSVVESGGDYFPD